MVMRLRYARLISVLVAVEEIPRTSYMFGSVGSDGMMTGR